MSLIVFLADVANDGHGSEESGLFPPFDPAYFPSQLFWLAITFGVLYIVLARMILPRLSANLEKRSDTIANDLDEAAKLSEQAEEAKQALEVSLAQARAKARETASKAEAAMAEEIAAETRKVDAVIDKKLEAAEARIDEVRTEAMANVETIAGDAAKSILDKLGLAAKENDISAAVKTAIGGKG
jgi:F-type H+-transporting ATPase subunit b